MFGTVNLPAFLISCVLLTIYPGPDTIYIIGRSVAQGRVAGLISVAGIVNGALIHTVLVSFGLSAVLTKSAEAFMLIKIAGALYLCYMGVRSLLPAKKSKMGDEPKGDSYLSSMGRWQIYRQGLVTNLLNPKIILFFLSFLPQFVDPVHNRGAISLLFLSITFLGIGTSWCLMVALFSGTIAEKLNRGGKATGYLEKLTGIVFILLAANILFR